MNRYNNFCTIYENRRDVEYIKMKHLFFIIVYRQGITKMSIITYVVIINSYIFHFRNVNLINKYTFNSIIYNY